MGDFRRQSGKKCALGYDFDAWGGAFGIEYAVEPHVFVGGGLGSLFGVNRASEGFSRIRQNLVMGGAYTGLRLPEKKNDAVWLHASQLRQLAQQRAFDCSRRFGAACGRLD